MESKGTSITEIRCSRYSWASCCRFVENSGWPRPISVLNIWGLTPEGTDGASLPSPATCAGGLEYSPDKSPLPSFALKHRIKYKIY